MAKPAASPLGASHARTGAGERDAAAGAARGSPGRAPGAAGGGGVRLPPRASGASREGGAGQQPAVAKPAVLTPRAGVCPGGSRSRFGSNYAAARASTGDAPPQNKTLWVAKVWHDLPGGFGVFLPLLLSFVL